MTLILQGIALDEQPISQPLVGRFDERGGTLGRSDTATLTLPDAERTISRIQAQVLHGDDGYWIENVSAANPILHNDRPLSSGMRVLLREGDELGGGRNDPGQRVALEQRRTAPPTRYHVALVLIGGHHVLLSLGGLHHQLIERETKDVAERRG